MMTENRHVKQWLTDYKSLASSNIQDFAKRISADDDLITSIFSALENGTLEHLAPVSSQLFEFYKSGHLDLQRFTLQFLPVITFQYLRCCYTWKDCGGLEAILLGIYNLEALEADGTPKSEVVRIPSLGKPSIYHEPSIQLAISDSLPLHQESEHRLVTRAPLQELENITADNRFRVMNELLRLFNADIGFYHPVSYDYFCKTCSEMCRLGFSDHQAKDTHQRLGVDLKLNLQSPAKRRIPMNAEFLLEMTHSLYYITFNGYASTGQETLEAIHTRAQYEMFAEVLLVTNAIRHSLNTNPSGRPQDGPVGINIAVTPASPMVKKAPITGASLKAKGSREITTITVTIESISTSDLPNGTTVLDGSSTAAQDGKQTDSMHRLVVDGNQRHKSKFKKHGNTNGANVQGETTNNPVEADVTTVTQAAIRHGKENGKHAERTNSNKKQTVTREAGTPEELAKLIEKGNHGNLNLTSIETSF